MYSNNRRKLYRSRDGVLLGVCQGIADWREMPVFSIRLLFILIAMFTAVVPVLLVYFGMALFLPLEPSGGDRDDRWDGGRPRDDRDRPDTGRDKERDWDQRFYGPK